MKQSILVFLYLSLLLIICPGLAGTEAEVSRREVTVTTTDEFLRALASNTSIYIDIPWGTAISFADQKIGEFSPYCNFTWAYDGVQLEVHDLKGLRIMGPEDTMAQILTPYSYANVIWFTNCEDLDLEWLSCGHDVEGYCTGGVLSFEYCKNVRIANCDLWGCGTQGLNILDTNALSCAYTTIRDCSYSIMTLYNSSDIQFKYCQMRNNGEYDPLEFTNSHNVSFENCLIWDNRSDGGYFSSSLIHTTDSSSRFSLCSIFNNNVETLINDETQAVFENCTIMNNRIQDLGY
ncbi:MAG TPA: right-handed parallel beta-helix repeat-containing protein [Candidatus Cloacimonadota bacterium]|nr:right-handed parallel beta-helix repeat-containing protein [Candidatus Cloacimonadota bacterium]